MCCFALEDIYEPNESSLDYFNDGWMLFLENQQVESENRYLKKKFFSVLLCLMHILKSILLLSYVSLLGF